MIDSKELRIGNYLLLSDTVVRVSEIASDHICVNGVYRPTDNPQFPIEYNPISCDDPNLHPFRLTDNVLSMITNVIPTSHGSAYRFSRSSTYLIYPDGEGNYFVGLDNKGELQRVTPTAFNTLHALQNIYYAMYGAEMPTEEGNLINALRHSRNYNEQNQ